MSGLSRRAFLRRTGVLAAAAAGLSPSLLFPRPRHPLIERATFTMGSIVTIKAYATDERRCLGLIDQAFAEMKAVDRLMSVYDTRSELSRINRLAAFCAVEVDERTMAVLLAARRFFDLTHGAFDVTVEPLMELYGFRDEEGRHRLPTDREIGDRLEGVGMQHVTLDRECSTVSVDHPRTRLDFGGIAVGFAIDRAAAVLRAGGVKAALINHAGDLYAIGAPPGAKAWEIGIRDPRNASGIVTTVGIRDEALSTSGNYEHSVAVGGTLIGHLLDPKSGRTASSLLSGTAIAPTAVEADALSTGCFVLGLERTVALLRGFRAERFIAVRDDGGKELVLTAGGRE